MYVAVPCSTVQHKTIVFRWGKVRPLLRTGTEGGCKWRVLAVPGRGEMYGYGMGTVLTQRSVARAGMSSGLDCCFP